MGSGANTITTPMEGGKPENMCELLDRIEAKGIKIGEAKGIKLGEAKGISIGLQRGTLRTLAELVNDHILTPAEAARRAGMTEKQFEREAALMIQQ